jgi:hypothetical protein
VVYAQRSGIGRGVIEQAALAWRCENPAVGGPDTAILVRVRDPEGDGRNQSIDKALNVATLAQQAIDVRLEWKEIQAAERSVLAMHVEPEI